MIPSSFVGRVAEGRREVLAIGAGGKAVPLDPRHDLHRHANGFEWGVASKGAAQLALALLASLDEELTGVAFARHQRLVWEVIAKLPPDQGWELSRGELLDWLEGHRELSG